MVSDKSTQGANSGVVDGWESLINGSNACVGSQAHACGYCACVCMQTMHKNKNTFILTSYTHISIDWRYTWKIYMKHHEFMNKIRGFPVCIPISQSNEYMHVQPQCSSSYSFIYLTLQFFWHAFTYHLTTYPWSYSWRVPNVELNEESFKSRSCYIILHQ